MDGKGLGNQLTRYGAVSASVPKLAPSAKVFLVAPSGSSWYGDFSKEFPADKEGTTRVFSTINSAVGQCVAGRGDVILVAPNHTENVTSATDLVPNVAGVSIVGLGEGQNRPTLTYITATTAAIPVGANNVTFENIRFNCNLASVAVAIDFSGFAGGMVRNCDFLCGGATKCFLITVKTDASSLDTVVDNCNFNYSIATSNTPTEAIRLVGCDRTRITNNYFSGNFSTAVINNVTTLVNDVQIEDNAIYNLSTTATAGIKMLTGTTGYIGGNACYTAAASNTNFFTTFITPASCALGLNTVQNTVGVGGDISAPAGSYVILQKIITSSTITTSAQDLSLLAVGGDLYVENVIFETDGTGLAGATNFRLLKDGGEGLVAICEETVANLGANKTVDSYTASVVKQRCTIKVGDKIQYLGTVGAGTGAGKVKVTVVLVRALAGANIALA